MPRDDRAGPRTACLLLTLGLAACGGGANGRDAGPDTGKVDAEGLDAGTADASNSDAAGADAATDGGARPGPYGFTVRSPITRTVPCDGMFCGGATTEAQDKDFVCTLEHGAIHGHYLYVAARPTRMTGFTGLSYAVDGAWTSDGTTATATTAIYDWGGNHNNDSITLIRADLSIKYFHSSFGFGFRKCQPMDCLQIFAPGGATPTEDGCTHDRTIPAVCVEVASDGTVPALVDAFMKCPGDPG